MTEKDFQHLFDGDGIPDDIPAEQLIKLPEGMAFFRPAQDRLPGLGPDWCVIDIFIDHFKYFAEWFGIDAGYSLLARIGAILRESAESVGGMAGFLGQEEFVLLAPADTAWIRGLFGKLQVLITSVCRIDGFTPVFGIARLDGSCSRILEYFNHASLAAEKLRGDIRTRIGFYDMEMHRRDAEEYRILCDFQSSLDSGEISFFLQPQVRASNGRIVGVESLARWHRGDGSWTSPAVFVPVLEKYGLVTRLDLYIWDSVCRWLHGMKQQQKPLIPVSVNVSQLDLASLDIPDHFAALLRRYDLPADCIKIEITESAYVSDIGKVRDVIARLHDNGFSVLMDDFGSGYSSLNMLRNLNVDVIKLDAQFLNLSDSSTAKTTRKGINILESVINMTRNLSIPVIVEGVETEGQMQFLMGMGCRYMQGFYFHRPMAPEQLEALIADESRLDRNGIRFKANRQLTAREFLDETVFTDTMLNNVLGAVALYRWDGDRNVDIIRYNEQFYELVDIDAETFSLRTSHIQDFFHPDDLSLFYELLREAETHPGIGSVGIVRVFRPNGTLVWLSLRMFYLRSDGHSRILYASLRDVTETQLATDEMPGAYFRCSADERYEFYFISRNFCRLTGYSEHEIRTLFDNCLSRMVHPADLPLLREQASMLARGELDSLQPYRLRRRRGDWIYVAEQGVLSDRFGALGWQCMLIDVSEVMLMRNQMRLLSDHLSSTVLFLHRRGDALLYEVTIHGLEKQLGMNAKEMEDALNSGAFCRTIEGSLDIPHPEYTRRFVAENAGGRKDLTIRRKDGARVRITVAVDRVDDDKTRIEYIMLMRVLNEEDIPAEGQELPS
ncbi:MAG: EAL domain-containing protein [Oscillospiraceae bacterium]|nr:EAL domain-containing protein [Oscillospiraceae bacterium]